MLGWLLNLGFAASGTDAVVVAVSEENSGGWPIYEPRQRKKKEEDRAEIILEDIPTEEQQPERKPKQRPRLKIGPKPNILSQSEIDQILASVQGEIDQEIAIYLRAIEKRRRRNLALVLLLDAA